MHRVAFGVAIALTAACARKTRLRATELDSLCKTGIAFRYIDDSDREAHRRLTADGCGPQIVEAVHDGSHASLAACCPE